MNPTGATPPTSAQEIAMASSPSELLWNREIAAIRAAHLTMSSAAIEAVQAVLASMLREDDIEPTATTAIRQLLHEIKTAPSQPTRHPSIVKTSRTHSHASRTGRRRAARLHFNLPARKRQLVASAPAALLVRRRSAPKRS